jgi:hypothetical protein
MAHGRLVDQIALAAAHDLISCAPISWPKPEVLKTFYFPGFCVKKCVSNLPVRALRA